MTSRRQFLHQAGWLGLVPVLPELGTITSYEPDLMTDDALFALIRKQLLIPANRLYLNTGSLGPSPLVVMDAVHAAMRELEMNPAAENWGPLGQRMEAVREIIAGYIHAEQEDILLTRNTTEGLSLVAQSIVLEPGDEILTTDQEHGGALVGLEYTTQNQGAHIRKMSLPLPTTGTDQILEVIRANLSDKTKMLLLSHVNTITGLVMPFAEIAKITRPRGILLVADGAQAPGQIPVDVSSLAVDAYATSGHKWLLGPKETGFLYVHPDLRPGIRSAFTQSGFAGYSASSGTRNVATIIGLGAAIQWHQEIGIERIRQRCLDIRNYCRERLQTLPGIEVISPDDESLSCGIVSYTLRDAKNNEVAQKLKDQDIIIKVLPGINGNRISCHLFVSKEDVDRFVEALSQAI
ncbi:MAG: aminotransferase class V-fold PLP-dependent enzyme [Saprospiraceae bacterium]|nr:aminotransferase class V-fold PLP-dependent enzyme [Saprospiraceae bacterium]